MEHYRGLVGLQWRGHSRYENVDADDRASFEASLQDILAAYPTDMQDVTPFIVGSWGMGNAIPLGDIDIVFAPADDALAPGLRERWLSLNDQGIRDLIAEVSQAHRILMQVSFGLKPDIGYDVAAHKVIGREYGVSVAKKYHYDDTLGGYVLEDLPLEKKSRGSYLDENGKKHVL